MSVYTSMILCISLVTMAGYVKGYINDTVFDVLFSNDGETYAGSLTIDLTGTWAFVGTDTGGGGAGIYKINLTAFALAQPRVNLAINPQYLYSAFVEASNTYVLFTALSTGMLVKAPIADFANPITYTFNASAGQSNLWYGFRSGFDTLYAYLLSSPGSNSLLKITLNTSTVVATLPLPAVDGLSQYQATLVGSAGTYAYFATFNATRSLLVKVSLVQFAVVATAYIPYPNVYNGFTDCSGTYGYFTTSRFLNGGQSVGYAIKVRLSTLSVAGVYTFPSGETEVISGVADPSGTYGYFGVQGPKVVQILLSNMTRVGSAQPTGLLGAVPLNAATDGAFAYFTLWGVPDALMARVPLTLDGV